MLKHNRILHKENDALKEENARLLHLVHAAQQRIKDISGSLQKNHVNIMPSITVCNDDGDSGTISKRSERVPSCFASAGHVMLDSPALCLSVGRFIAAGQSNGDISLWSVQESDQPRPSSGVLYRFNSSDQTGPRLERSSSASPLSKAMEELHGHVSAVTSIIWNDQDEISSVSLDSTLRIWDVTNASCQTFPVSIPAISHAQLDQTYVVASCTRSIFVIDPREGIPNEVALDNEITAVAATNLGMILGTSSGALMLYDPKMNKVYQELQVSQARLPISKISGFSNVTVTSFDGIVRLIGTELPLYVEKEFSRAPINGSIIGSCCVSLANRDDFVISGSTIGKTIVWSSQDSIHTLGHPGSIIYDCVPLNNFVGSFVTCDSSKNLTMWARSFDQTSV